MQENELLEQEYYYHGSRGGIDGPISPISRARTDFGRAFYMGTDVMQTERLAINDVYPCEYTLRVDFSPKGQQNLIFLEGMAWLFTVLHFRRNCEAFRDTALDSWIGRQVDGADWIVGAIADDSMSRAVKDFSAGYLTTVGLFECLRKIPFGYQLAAKTQRACDAIEIVSEHVIDVDEVRQIWDESRRLMDKNWESTEAIRVRTLDKGMNVYELVDEMSEEHVSVMDPSEIGFHFLSVGGAQVQEYER